MNSRTSLPNRLPGSWNDSDGLKRGIGYILVDYVLRYGFSMPTETGFEAPLADRADCHFRAVLAGIEEFEKG